MVRLIGKHPFNFEQPLTRLMHSDSTPPRLQPRQVGDLDRRSNRNRQQTDPIHHEPTRHRVPEPGNADHSSLRR